VLEVRRRRILAAVAERGPFGVVAGARFMTDHAVVPARDSGVSAA
jgi:hypothetical protein